MSQSLIVWLINFISLSMPPQVSSGPAAFSFFILFKVFWTSSSLSFPTSCSIVSIEFHFYFTLTFFSQQLLKVLFLSSHQTCSSPVGTLSLVSLSSLTCCSSFQPDLYVSPVDISPSVLPEYPDSCITHHTPSVLPLLPPSLSYLYSCLLSLQSSHCSVFASTLLVNETIGFVNPGLKWSGTVTYRWTHLLFLANPDSTLIIHLG